MANLVSLSSKSSLSPSHSFRETSIVQQSASSLHGQSSFIPLQVIQENKPYPGCTISARGCEKVPSEC
ncbi:hypothetical protein F2Q68_00043987 [Brassica cretica]|uniref:Uncharacterized protein n=1 Tax=Brassica cretica TaxID=69181 RepID=A0A8S9LKG6_BRACR|nr:hypothetical protein F2Q68_00043987 [Brassica cretica]